MKHYKLLEFLLKEEIKKGMLVKRCKKLLILMKIRANVKKKWVPMELHRHIIHQIDENFKAANLIDRKQGDC